MKMKELLSRMIGRGFNFFYCYFVYKNIKGGRVRPPKYCYQWDFRKVGRCEDTRMDRNGF